MVDRRQFVMGARGGMFVFRQLPDITRLNDTLSLVTGAGTNVLALSTSDGLILVDSGAPQYGSALSKGVRTVFNTHYHLENTGSNEGLAQAGAKIIAHENTKEWMETRTGSPRQTDTSRRV